MGAGGGRCCKSRSSMATDSAPLRLTIRLPRCPSGADCLCSVWQHSPQLQYTPPQSPYTASPRGVWTADSGGVGGNASANSNSAASTPNSSTDATTPTQQRWAGTPVLGMSPAGSSTRAGVVVGSPISVQSAVAASAAAAAAAAVSAASAAAAAGVGDVGRGASGSGAGGGGAGAGAGGGGEKLEQLKKEKRVLHVMLKNFEKDFKEKNGREVRKSSRTAGAKPCIRCSLPLLV